MADAPRPCTLILGGGLALGAYHAGAVRTLLADETLDIQAIGGASIGAIMAALIAGTPPDDRIAALDAFWATVGRETGNSFLPSAGGVRHLANWGSALTSRTAGVANMFRPRWPGEREEDGPCPALYSNEPLRRLLADRIDFARLNSAGPRLCISTTDVLAGEVVLFDTAAGDVIALEHVLASGALMPAFSPMQVGERLLADGGFAANAPLEPFLASDRIQPSTPLVILVDLFSPDDAAPTSLEASLARSQDLLFAMQTRLRLEALVRERALEARIAPEVAGTDLFHISYRPLPHEAGSEKAYDLSRATLRDRQAVGTRDAARLLRRMCDVGLSSEAGLRVHRIGHDGP
ncbi:patatin-like phospholipase family protein [Sphingomonas jatrophae]|uniref:NTE family protein n=1 Tax=Sphingomonas jatrophae TaxID=1166337 RepID=A0A1I6J9W2_9SPHN|nr:patatin-like phospholipase family protein [Sphingomonas jatrophae]SFR75785.1 NTE family protein [Sphingomonas jatrophae]